MFFQIFLSCITQLFYSITFNYNHHIILKQKQYLFNLSLYHITSLDNALIQKKKI